jgi:pre-mRNA-splicing factor CDC5/CEF1
MRYHVKGGIWKNTEDEILKAAIMKYGLNQWSRISSLLVRKSAKQCKERWYEWLDPQIKKTEWTQEEEEKLLQLAKMFPCQWRTIAPIIGRTAFQSMEHYEKLLDRAQGREPDENDPRRLRPGEIDPNPETKPARPDPIDMDEDVKEMLNEARARLANTRGKKAKRKAREKQLEEARRLAALQKKRELKSAGIDVVLRLPRKKKKETNYLADIPFHRKAPEGSWAAGPEETPSTNKFRGAISLQLLENRNRDEDEEKFKKIDAKRMKNLKQKDLPAAIDMINKMNDPKNIIQRNSLILPEPQVTDKDIEGIAKLTGMEKGYVASSEIIQESNATKVLIGQYTSQREAAPLSTLRTPKIEDTVMREAKLAINLREGDTPLIGGENAIDDYQDYLNYKKTEVRVPNTNINSFKAPITPNILYQNNKSIQNNETKASIKSNLRDEMKINLEEDLINSWENSRNKTDSFLAPSVKNLLSSLPKPVNKYDISLMDDVSMEAIKNEEQVSEKKQKIEEDSEEKDKRLLHERIEREKIEFLQQSKVIQRKLPRPAEINYTYRSDNENNIEDDSDVRLYAEELIRNEMVKLVEYDMINFPIKGAKINVPADRDVEMEVEEYSLEEKNIANKLIEEEVEVLRKLNTQHSEETICKIREEVGRNIFYFPNKQRYLLKLNFSYHYISEQNDAAKFESIKENIDISKSLLVKEDNISKKLEEKGKILTNGFMKRFLTLNSRYEELILNIRDLNTKKNVYEQLRDMEKEAIIKRKNDMLEYLQKLKNRENELQAAHKRFQERLEELQNL